MLTKEEIRHLAWLARIEIGERELESYSKQVGDILGYLGTLDAISLEGVKPEKIIVDQSRIREDEAVEFRDDALGVAKNRKANFVKAPKMV
jgi:aspartyl-tRNA(Asn)/glutamyl-tRNA(Gln) amidotransferase subunit C